MAVNVSDQFNKYEYIRPLICLFTDKYVQDNERDKINSTLI